ncbi:reverse transcriptase [Elysia marginata]|uniref:Reverse transcriptase n=1 Tax=Elysia marginata TaxID=1093978 RepID=A0AAV4JGA7_9GAST|nr:reverse transcriptase [Elysia marginata]
MHTIPKIVKEVENYGPEAQLSEQEIMNFTNKYLHKKYPIKEWVRIYTDGSATDAVRNGGCEVYATRPDRSTLDLWLVNRLYQLQGRNRSHQGSPRLVPQTLENTKDTERDLRQNLLGLRARVGGLTLKWISGHSNIEGNEKANNLAKLGSGLEQDKIGSKNYMSRSKNNDQNFRRRKVEEEQ